MPKVNIFACEPITLLQWVSTVYTYLSYDCDHIFDKKKFRSCFGSWFETMVHHGKEMALVEVVGARGTCQQCL